MYVIRTLSDPANGIRASKGGQTVQVERVAAVRKPPKNREVRVNGGYNDWNVAGRAFKLEPFWKSLFIQVFGVPY